MKQFLRSAELLVAGWAWHEKNWRSFAPHSFVREASVQTPKHLKMCDTVRPNELESTVLIELLVDIPPSKLTHGEQCALLCRSEGLR